MTKNHHNEDDKKNFVSDLSSILKKLGKRHGVSISDPSVVDYEGVYFVNIMACSGSIDSVYASLYEHHCESLGLPIYWLNQGFYFPRYNRYLTVVGLDPNVGESIVKVRDKDDNYMNMTPSEVFFLMSESISKSAEGA